MSFVLYPQNGDRIVTIDSVTSFHPVYTCGEKLTRIEETPRVRMHTELI